MKRYFSEQIPFSYTILIVTIAIGTLTLNMINGRFWLADFQVYYMAVQAFLSGEQVYLVLFEGGSGYYKYSPVTLFMFLPYTLLPFKAAAVVHFIFLSFCFWYLFITMRDLMVRHEVVNVTQKKAWWLIATFVLTGIHFAREMHLGNINVLLLLLCCLAAGQFLEGRRWKGSLFLAMVVLLKPFYLIILLPFLVRGRWRDMLSTALAVLAGMLLPFLYPGPREAINLYDDWFTVIYRHSDDFPGMTSIGYLLRHYWVTTLPVYATLLIYVIVTGVVMLFIFSNRSAENGHPQNENRNILFEWFVLLALLPSLLRTDWVQLLLSSPLIMYLLITTRQERKYAWIPLLVVIFFFFSANSDDLLGRELSKKILVSGLMGISNLAIIFLSAYWYHTHTHTHTHTH